MPDGGPPIFFGKFNEVIDLFLRYSELDGITQAFIHAKPWITFESPFQIVVRFDPSGVVFAHPQIRKIGFPDLSHNGQVFLAFVLGHRLNKLIIWDSVCFDIFFPEISTRAWFDQRIGIIGIEFQSGKGTCQFRVLRSGQFDILVFLTVIVLVFFFHAQI